jgi:hypothetical protein
VKTLSTHSRISSLWSSLQHPVTPSLFGPKNLLSTMFSKTLYLCSSLEVTDSVSNTRKENCMKVGFTYFKPYIS